MAGSQLQEDRHDATVLETEAGTRLDAFLAARFRLFSRNRIKDLILTGAVSVDGTTNDVPKYRVRTGESITLAAPEPVEAEPQPQDIALNILFEDEYLIVIDKPAGMVVHPAPGNEDGTLVNALIFHCGESLRGIGGVKRPGIVHRLDKDTSGVMVAAKTELAHNGLAAQFADHGRTGPLERAYFAFVWGIPNPLVGTVETMIGRDPHNRLKQSEIRKFPMLDPDEEFMLAKRYKEHSDPQAAQKLITSHLRLVAKIAMGYRGYGLPISEVISEGNVGLMQAVKRFEPDKGFRLATYAMWWIRASIQEYVLRSWSLVKIGTTAAQKRLFFNLRRIKGQIAALEDGNLHPDQIKQIATTLKVSENDVVSMNQRLTGDASLNAPMRADEGTSQWQDWLIDDVPDQEETLGNCQEYDERMGLLEGAMEVLNDREKAIFKARRLQESPSTLEELAQEYDVSRERIRQIEVRAFEKVQDAVKEAARTQAAH
eukprot:jgi/Tetstr1/451531/TSEL_038567.t1